MTKSTRRQGNRAVVLGASMAGLTCARVLSDHFAEVLVLDRDELPDTATFRAGVPQSKHSHALLRGGLELLGSLFPGIHRELLDLGAVTIHWPRDVLWHSSAGWGERYSDGLEFCSMSRELLEHCVRSRVRKLPNVRLVGGAEVVALRQDSGTVVGVTLGGRTLPEHPPTMDGDLIVDASGRGLQLPRWLGELGFPAPTETCVNAHLGYATQMYEPPDAARSWKMLFLQARAPDELRSALVLPIEEGKWLVTLGGYGGDYPPTQPKEFVRFIDGLRTPLLREVLANAKPLGSISGYRGTENRLRHFEKLERWPDGLVALGDSVSAFNPIYGQGMTVAAQGAKLLDSALTTGAGSSAPGFGLRFQKALAKSNNIPWLMATGEDRRFPTTEGPKPSSLERLFHSYLDRLILVATRRADVGLQLIKILHLSVPLSGLFHPTLLLAAATGGKTRPLLDPPLSAPSPSSAQQERRRVNA